MLLEVMVIPLERNLANPMITEGKNQCKLLFCFNLWEIKYCQLMEKKAAQNIQQSEGHLSGTTLCVFPWTIGFSQPEATDSTFLISDPHFSWWLILSALLQGEALTLCRTSMRTPYNKMEMQIQKVKACEKLIACCWHHRGMPLIG